jgi:phosphoglycolate phosphatase
VKNRQRFAAVLFDMDGTLVETRKDIATGVNLALADRGFPPLTVDRVARHVGRGSRVLVTRCLEECGVVSPRAEEIESTYQSFHGHYLDHLLDTTFVYPGIPELLDRIAAAGVPMAVVTNKPIAPSRKILDGLDLASYFPVVLGGESLSQRKPDPAPLLHALELLGAEEGRGVMVGDSEIDIKAARAARIAIAAVAWGFIGGAELLDAAPDFIAESAAALTDWLLG